MVLTNNNATNRIGPTLTVSRVVHRLCPSMGFLCINAPGNVRHSLIGGTNFSFTPVRITNFRHGVSIRGLGEGTGTTVCLLGSNGHTGTVVGSFGPSLIVNANNCIDNPVILRTTGVNVGALVRRRGTFPKIAAGILSGGISEIVLAIPGTVRRLSYSRSGYMIANLPIEDNFSGTGVNGARTEGRLNVSSSMAILSANKDLNTNVLGRAVPRLLR